MSHCPPLSFCPPPTAPLSTSDGGAPPVIAPLSTSDYGRAMTPSTNSLITSESSRARPSRPLAHRRSHSAGARCNVAGTSTRPRIAAARASLRATSLCARRSDRPSCQTKGSSIVRLGAALLRSVPHLPGSHLIKRIANCDEESVEDFRGSNRSIYRPGARESHGLLPRFSPTRSPPCRFS